MVRNAIAMVGLKTSQQTGRYYAFCLGALCHSRVWWYLSANFRNYEWLSIFFGASTSYNHSLQNCLVIARPLVAHKCRHCLETLLLFTARYVLSQLTFSYMGGGHQLT